MGVSRGPIREAIRMLEQEGLLYSHPYKETTVAEITEEEVREVLLPIRMTIERFALTKALPRIGEAELARLESILADMKQGADYNQLSQIVNCDLAFHEYLITLADMPGLLVTWTSIFNRIHLHFMVQGQKYDDYAELWKEHTKLLDAIKSGDLERVQEELTVHIQQYK
jgi:DNA-binding GntR family transcriptional regulator